MDNRFTRAKYGTFIHWGLYSILAGEWKGEILPDSAEWIMRLCKIPYSEYSRLANQFNPTDFNADEWMSKIAGFGSKYVCVTAKHHDGFAMYDTHVSDYSITHTPFHRDILRELADACRRHGMMFCVYYSQMQDWADPDGDGNTWDYNKEEKDFDRYFYGKVVPQVTELLTEYGEIGMIWFDTPYDMPIERCKELRALVKRLQPNCVINGRIGYGLGDYRQMSDNCFPANAYNHPWETPVTLNRTWGYSKTDEDWKSPSEIVTKLAEVVSRGGNMLLNIGPDSLGRIPEKSLEILSTVGAWLKDNGESIYDCGVCQDMPYVIPWGVCTAKDNHLYMHVLRYPKPPYAVWLFNLQMNAKSVKLLKTGDALEYTQTYEPARHEDRFRVYLPETPVDAIDTVVDVEYEGELRVVALDELDKMGEGMRN